MISWRQQTPIALLALLTLSISCGRVKEMARPIRDLLAIQTSLAKDLGEVHVQLMNGDHLVVDVVNSPLRDLPPHAKRTKAWDIARRAYDAYAAASRLKSIRVAFALHRTYFGVVQYNATNTTDAFDFATPPLSEQRSSLER